MKTPEAEERLPRIGRSSMASRHEKEYLKYDVWEKGHHAFP